VSLDTCGSNSERIAQIGSKQVCSITFALGSRQLGVLSARLLHGRQSTEALARRKIYPEGCIPRPWQVDPVRNPGLPTPVTLGSRLLVANWRCRRMKDGAGWSSRQRLFGEGRPANMTMRVRSQNGANQGPGHRGGYLSCVVRLAVFLFSDPSPPGEGLLGCWDDIFKFWACRPRGKRAAKDVFDMVF
jgi:hypothetical protein